MRRLVSILIPAYHASEWIADTLESAVAQTWPDKEIIVVDDGSRDRTFEIAQRFASRGVTVARQANAGAAAARNAAFALSRGDFIQWLDADDLLAPDKIAKQMEVAAKHDNPRLLLSAAWGRFMYRPSRVEFVPTDLWADRTPVEWLVRKMDQNLHMQTATWLVSRELTEAAGPWNTKLLGDDDGEYFCRVLLQSEGVRFVRDSEVLYRMAGPGSLSYIGRSNPKIDAQLHSMHLHIGYLRSLEDSDRVRTACVNYLQNWLPFFYPDRPDVVAQAEQMAAELGGRLERPALSWKYSWINALFGRTAAKRAQVSLPRMKWSVIRLWDKTLFRLQNQPL